MLLNALKKLFKILSSLKLAVLVILSIAISLAVATVIESLYDTPTAQFWVYQSTWFYGLLGLLGLNILLVALDRLPWKQRHLPFLLAHLGILILLVGSWITWRVGIDGSMRITEGESSSVVELDESFLFVSDTKKVYSIQIPWLPPMVHFKPFNTQDYALPFDLKVDQFLTHADPEMTYVPDSDPSHDKLNRAAVQILVEGGVMKIRQELWLWQGEDSWEDIQAGPARFSLGKKKELKKGQPTLFLNPDGNSLRYQAFSAFGKKLKGQFKKPEGQKIHPGWKGDVTIQILRYIPSAMPYTIYKPAEIQYGSNAPFSALHLVAADQVGVWLGLGDRAVVHLAHQDVTVAYFPRRVILPFSLKLERFIIENNPGTLTPAAYSSRVRVIEEKEGESEFHISMNEPLEKRGFTLYQASYENAEPRPTVSIFAVNRDPGRVWKYLGSFLLVLGTMLLSASKYRKKKTQVSIQKVSIPPIQALGAE